MSQIEVADRAALPLKTLGKFRWPQTVLPRLLWFNLRPPSLCPSFCVVSSSVSVSKVLSFSQARRSR